MTAKRAYRTTFEALDALHAERDAALLPMIKAALERRHVTDPEVWDGYPCSAAEDDESDYYGGLFLNLERCARLDPSGVTSKAIRITFKFGRRRIVSARLTLRRWSAFWPTWRSRSAAIRKAGRQPAPKPQPMQRSAIAF